MKWVGPTSTPYRFKVIISEIFVFVFWDFKRIECSHVYFGDLSTFTGTHRSLDRRNGPVGLSFAIQHYICRDRVRFYALLTGRFAAFCSRSFNGEPRSSQFVCIVTPPWFGGHEW